jgi:hypothetical protein
MNAIQQLQALKFEEEPLSYQGIDFIVREMTAKEKTEYEAGLYTFKQNGKSLQATPNLEGMKQKLVIYCLYDTEGKKVFKGIEDLPLVDGLPSAFVDAVADKASKLTGLNQEQEIKN